MFTKKKKKIFELIGVHKKHDDFFSLEIGLVDKTHVLWFFKQNVNIIFIHF